MKKEKFAYIILIVNFYLSMFSLLFLKWISNSDILYYTNVLCTILILLINFSNIKFKRSYINLLFIFLIYAIINLLITPNHTYFISYFVKQTIIPFLSVILTISLISDEEQMKKKILTPSFILFNLYYIINFLIILKQIENPSFMLRNYTANNFYKDHIDGLLGANGTHRLAYFQLFCLYLNIMFFDSKNKMFRLMSKIMFIFVLITSCYASVFNDNRMYFFLVVIYLIPFINFGRLFKKKDTKRLVNGKHIMKAIMVIIAAFLLFFLAFNISEKFNDFVKTQIYEEYILKTYNKVTGSINDENSGKEERVELLRYAINEGKMTGKGIGVVTPGNSDIVIKHFGLNEMNIRIYSGGIIFAIIILIIYTKTYSEAFKNVTSIRKIFIKLYLLVTIILSSIYFQTFTYPTQTMIFSAIYLLMAYKYNQSNKVENGEEM